MTVVVLINDKFNIVYLDNVIFHRLQRRLSDRNYGCRRRPRYLIFSQFSICCCQNAFASGALPRTPPGGLQRSQLANVGSHHCRGPHRIAGPRAPRPHDPPLYPWCRLEYKYCRGLPIYLLCHDYPTLAHHEPIQLQVRAYISLLFNASMTILMK